MWKGTQHTDFNGIVLFDPDALKAYYGRIKSGANLFKRFTTTTDGDEILALGICVPILAIDDAVTREAALADLAVFRDWERDLGWQRLPIAAGRYGVSVRGFRRLAKTRHKIVDAGYEFVLRRVRKLPAVSANTGAKMRTLKFEDGKGRAPAK